MEAPPGSSSPERAASPKPEAQPPPPEVVEPEVAQQEATSPQDAEQPQETTPPPDTAVNGLPSTKTEDETGKTEVVKAPPESSITNDNYIGPLTTEEIIKVYDEKEKISRDTISESLESILIDKVLLANLECGDAETKTAGNSLNNDNTETNTTEDLLAILEGETNKTPPPSAPPTVVPRDVVVKVVCRPRIKLNPELEKTLALKQLKELPSGKRKSSKSTNPISDVTIPSIKSSNAKRFTVDASSIPAKNDENSTPNEITSPKKVIKTYSKSKSNDISFIADDWSDDEVSAKPEPVKKKTKCLNSISTLNGNDTSESSLNNPVVNTSEQGLGNRRVSRVIKKKIIWDPDNPDSFKLTSSVSKKKSIDKPDDNPDDSDPKKQKVVLTKLRKSEERKSQETKLTAEKSEPTPTKQNNSIPGSGKKRKMTEVDKLMMDEGVVNMMQDLEKSNADVPDSTKKLILPREKRAITIKDKVVKTISPKEKKNYRNKESNSNGVKMPKKNDSRVSIENSDAIPDESRIIRRHSSSSFSSGCLSPRPQSPSDTPKDAKKSTKNANHSPTKHHESPPGIKRKLSAGKVSPGKIKKLADNSNKSTDQIDSVDVKIETGKSGLLNIKKMDNCFHINIKKHNTQGLFDAKMMLELTNAIKTADKLNMRVLTLTSEDGMLCGGLDLQSILHTRITLQRSNTSIILEAMSDLVMELCHFKGALIFGIDGPCTGFGVALLSLADLVLASDRATFCVAPTYRRQLPPEGISLLTLNNFMSGQLSRELVYCARKLTASEALHRGIIARTLWPDRFADEIIETAKDIAQYPQQVFNISKSVLRSDYANVEKVLQDEAVLLAEFWCTPSGQEGIRMTHSNN